MADVERHDAELLLRHGRPLIDADEIIRVRAIGLDPQQAESERASAAGHAGGLRIEDRERTVLPFGVPVGMAGEIELRARRETGIEPGPPPRQRLVVVRIRLVGILHERRHVRRDNHLLAARLGARQLVGEPLLVRGAKRRLLVRPPVQRIGRDHPPPFDGHRRVVVAEHRLEPLDRGRRHAVPHIVVSRRHNDRRMVHLQQTRPVARDIHPRLRHVARDADEVRIKRIDDLDRRKASIEIVRVAFLRHQLPGTRRPQPELRIRAVRD